LQLQCCLGIELIAIVGTINIANYISTNQALDARLSLIADNGGTFPDMTPGDSGKKLEPKSDQPPAMNDLQKHGISQESPFDTRYFYSDDRIGRYGGVCGYRKKLLPFQPGQRRNTQRSCGKKERKKAFSLIINILQRTSTARRYMYF